MIYRRSKQIRIPQTGGGNPNGKGIFASFCMRTEWNADNGPYESYYHTGLHINLLAELRSDCFQSLQELVPSDEPIVEVSSNGQVVEEEEEVPADPLTVRTKKGTTSVAK